MSKAKGKQGQRVGPVRAQVNPTGAPAGAAARAIGDHPPRSAGARTPKVDRAVPAAGRANIAQPPTGGPCGAAPRLAEPGPTPNGARGAGPGGGAAERTHGWPDHWADIGGRADRAQGRG